MSYAVTVDVKFDPSFLCEHDWRPADLGLAKFICQESCAKCGMTKVEMPPVAVGINRDRVGFWSMHDNRGWVPTAPEPAL